MKSALGRHRLVPHPETPPNSVASVIVQIARSNPRELWLEYELSPAGGVVLPQEAEPERADELWKSTCFELFVQPFGSPGYLEFNFAPSFRWAAYAFDAYRSGMKDFPSHDPEITISHAGNDFFLAVEAMPDLPDGPLKIGISAVIEEVDGTKSFWALSHPAAKPDFHNARSFTLEFP